jgi:hypothetical protein
VTCYLLYLFYDIDISVNVVARCPESARPGVNARARLGAYGANGQVIAGPDADNRVRLLVAAAKAATTAAGC